MFKLLGQTEDFMKASRGMDNLQIILCPLCVKVTLSSIHSPYRSLSLGWSLFCDTVNNPILYSSQVFGSQGEARAHMLEEEHRIIYEKLRGAIN